MAGASRALEIATASGSVSALYSRPRNSRALLVLAHGAGAGMRHPFLQALSEALAERSIATLRYQFPFMEAGRKLPDRAPTLESCVRDAVDRARRLARGLPIFAGGKSLGGRMTSQAHSQSRLRDVCGIVFLGFPLHPFARPEKADERAAHLHDTPGPMLFVQGTRDKLAELPLLQPVTTTLGERASLHIIDGADHGFEVLASAGRTHASVTAEVAKTVADWCVALSAPAG